MGMGLSDFHFAEPWWLAALAVPLLIGLLPSARGLLNKRYQDYADAALLPHLLITQERATERRRRRFALWSLLWSLGCLAMAGPRWDYRDVDLLQPGADLVVLLDISRSMAVTDVKPSRLARARQELEDLLDGAENLRVGVIAFASVAHVVAPVTEDLATVRYMLPALSTDLIKLGGSGVDQALIKAARLLAGLPPGSTHSLLLISDGDFDQPGLRREVARLTAKGVRLHVLGIGTREGAHVPQPSPRGGWIKDAQGRKVVSHLEESALRALAELGGGIYQRADYRDDDTQRLLAEIESGAGHEETVIEGSRRIWHERFYWLVGLMLLAMLPWFRSGSRT